MFVWYAEEGRSLVWPGQEAAPGRGDAAAGQGTLERADLARHPDQPGLHRRGLCRAPPGGVRYRARRLRPGACDRGRTGSRLRRSRPLSPRSNSNACRPNSPRTGNSHAATIRLKLICCGAWSAVACAGWRASAAACGRSYRYYCCRGKLSALHSHRETKCRSRFIPAEPIESLVWEDLCRLLTHPEAIRYALERAHGGHWLPQDLQARRDALEAGASPAWSSRSSD